MMDLFKIVYAYLTPDRDIYITEEPNDTDQILAHGNYSEIFDFADNVLMHFDEPLAELLEEKLDEYCG